VLTKRSCLTRTVYCNSKRIVVVSTMVMVVVVWVVVHVVILAILVAEIKM
jgi:hypothetical protein